VAPACGETTFEADTRGATASDASAPSSPDPSVPLAGTAEELLPLLATAAGGLSTVMIEGGDDQRSADRIAALWAAVRLEVSDVRPDLLANFDANVGRCATAVRFNRAADADKAAANIRALVDAYLG
jgi:hypothetical protein